MQKIWGILILGLLLAGCATYSEVKYSGGDGKIVKADNDRILLGFDGWHEMESEDIAGNILRYAGSRAAHASSEKNKLIAAEHCKSKDKFAYFFGDMTESDALNINGAAIFICSSTHLKISSISGVDSNYYRGYKKSIYWDNYDEDSLIYKKGVIAEAKEMCEDLGFKPGTDNFAGCAMRMVLGKLPPKQSSSSDSSGSMTIYDPVRDNQRMIDQGMKMLSGRCTLGIDC